MWCLPKSTIVPYLLYQLLQYKELTLRVPSVACSNVSHIYTVLSFSRIDSNTVMYIIYTYFTAAVHRIGYFVL